MEAPERVCSAVLIFYCLCPVIYGYLNAVVKDTIYAAFFTLFVCRVADVHLKKEIQKKDIWFLTIDGILLILFRNNGFYIGAITSHLPIRRCLAESAIWITTIARSQKSEKESRM